MSKITYETILPNCSICRKPVLEMLCSDHLYVYTNTGCAEDRPIPPTNRFCGICSSAKHAETIKKHYAKSLLTKRRGTYNQ